MAETVETRLCLEKHSQTISFTQPCCVNHTFEHHQQVPLVQTSGIVNLPSVSTKRHHEKKTTKKDPGIFRIRCSHDTLQMLLQKHPSDSFGLFLPSHHLKPLDPRQLYRHKKNEFTKCEWRCQSQKQLHHKAQLQKTNLKHQFFFKSFGCFR